MRLCQICNKHSNNWSTKTICKKCYRKIWDKEHPDKRGKVRHHRPERRFKYGMKSAKNRNILWEISLLDFKELLLKPCYYCNNLLGKQIHCGCGLDRIDNTKGYELNNVLPCCPICNLIKNTNLTVDETKVAVEAILKYRKLDRLTDKPGSVNNV